ncbi:MAG: hypothetical protein HQK67_01680 [Desulfamplus sp.]|nr:hypothetical protein [Desulfamplus sp.]
MKKIVFVSANFCVLLFIATISLFVFPNNALAIYDKIAINITPNDNDVNFCFDFDTLTYVQGSSTVNKAYLAAITDAGDILFVSLKEPMITSWTPVIPTNQIPAFMERGKEDTPACIGEFNKEAINNIDLYLAIGTSFDEALSQNRLIRFFDGFPTTPQPEREWTVMVYMVGSDLESKSKHWASKDILEMVQGSALGVAGSSDQIKNENDSANIVVATGGSNRSGWDTLKRSWIHNGQNYVMEDLGLRSMTEPDNLVDFITWSHNKFPAKHYALILWNHGNGVEGFGHDTSGADDGTMMGLPKLQEAYQKTREQIGKNLDIVVYDACLMASLEVAQVTSTLANAMGASAELEPGHGIDYSFLINGLQSSNIDNGIDFGKLVKTGYIEHAKAQGTYKTSQITYSVFDLSVFKQFEQTFEKFAGAFKQELQSASSKHDNYEATSRGLIQSVGYPIKSVGRLYSLEENNIRIDFSGFLNSLSSNLPAINDKIEALKKEMDQLVVDYEGNIDYLDNSAGKMSIDIGSNLSYLSTLPQSFQWIKDGFASYRKTKANDGYNPEGTLVPYNCPEGIVCADLPNWLELESSEVINIDAYFGKFYADHDDIFLIKHLYRYKETTNDIELPLKGGDVCSYEMCVSDGSCQIITVTEDGQGVLTGEAVINGSPAILTFCPISENSWSVCGVAQKIQNIWGRDEELSSDDRITPIVLEVRNKETKIRKGTTVLVQNADKVILNKVCSITDKTILVSYYGNNGQKQTEKICTDDKCESAGVILKYEL